MVNFHKSSQLRQNITQGIMQHYQHNASWCLQLSTGWFVVLLEQCFPIRVPALTETYSTFFIYQCQLNNKMFKK